MFEPGMEHARSLDASDPLARLRDRFAFPEPHNRDEVTYLVGNSLGLQPHGARDLVVEEMDKWAKLGVRGHFEGDRPWAPFHEFLSEPMARLVGATPAEVVVMNGLTVNLHLLMASFYRPILSATRSSSSTTHSPLTTMRWSPRSSHAASTQPRAS